MLKEQVARNISKKLNEPEWLLTKRLESYKQFNELDLPVFRYGIGIWINLKDLDFNSVNPEEITDELVINNDEVEILNLKDALVKYEDEIRDLFVKQELIYTKNKLDALHTSFFNNGLFIRIPENKNVSRPILINLNLKYNRIEYILVIAEKHSNAIIIEYSNSVDTKKQLLRSQVVDVVVKENARLEYKSVQDLGYNVYNLVKRKGHVAENGSLLWVDCCIGSKFTQNNTRTYLEGENSEGKSWGIAYGDKEQVYDINGETVHVASRTVSDMMAKVVLNDKAKTVYRGLVKIKPGSINCEGFQQEDTILLSQNAQANTVPNLEIENNEVRCSHGATITQIDNEKLFYMTSRGIDEKKARRAIVEGFFEPIIVSIDDEKIKQDVENSLARRLDRIN